jgi:hypothetical protein
MRLSQTLTTLLELEKQEPLTTSRHIRRNICKQARRWCDKHGVVVVQVPFASVNWRRVAFDSLYRRPPFSPGKSEKGFRDALILESIKSIASRHGEAEIIVATNDDLLRDTCSSQLSITVVKDGDEFLSRLRAEQTQSTMERVNLFTVKATKVFYEKGNPGCLFEKGACMSLIRQKFPDAFNVPPPLTDSSLLFAPIMESLKPISDDNIQAGISLYFRDDKFGRHHWDTSITITTYFEGKLHHLAGLPYEYERKLVFKASWRAEVSESGTYSDEVIEDVIHVSSHLKAVGFSPLDRSLPKRNVLLPIFGTGDD